LSILVLSLITDGTVLRRRPPGRVRIVALPVSVVYFMREIAFSPGRSFSGVCPRCDQCGKLAGWLFHSLTQSLFHSHLFTHSLTHSKSRTFVNNVRISQLMTFVAHFIILRITISCFVYIIFNITVYITTYMTITIIICTPLSLCLQQSVYDCLRRCFR